MRATIRNDRISREKPVLTVLEPPEFLSPNAYGFGYLQPTNILLSGLVAEQAEKPLKITVDPSVFGLTFDPSILGLAFDQNTYVNAMLGWFQSAYVEFTVGKPKETLIARFRIVSHGQGKSSYSSDAFWDED